MSGVTAQPHQAIRACHTSNRSTVHLLFVACGEEPARPPSQQAVEHAQKRADDAVRQSVEAERQVRHARRLRDIDRLRYEVSDAEWHSLLLVMRGLLLAVTAVLLATLVWLAIEIRRRRILSAVVHTTFEVEAGLTRINEESLHSAS